MSAAFVNKLMRGSTFGSASPVPCARGAEDWQLPTCPPHRPPCDAPHGARHLLCRAPVVQSTISVDWNDANLDGTFAAGERTGSVEYLIENSNFTGYQQTILETVKNASGQATKRTTYTFGTDEITQTVSQIDSSSQLITQSSTLTFAHDGKGSVRALFGAAAAIAQVFTYSAYGELLAIYNSAGTLQPLASSLTSVLYNGEGLDARTGLYNMRARWYSASNARWERLDPFAGNPTDPFSFNKYGFVHGDPIGMTDPTGLFGFGGLSTGSFISIQMRALGIQVGRAALAGGFRLAAKAAMKRVILNVAEYTIIDNHLNKTVEAMAGLAYDLSGINSPTLEWMIKNINSFLGWISFFRRINDVSLLGVAIPFASANPDFPGSQLSKWVGVYKNFKTVAKWTSRSAMAIAFLGGTPLVLASLNQQNRGNPNNIDGDLKLSGYETPTVIMARVAGGSLFGTVPGLSVWLPDIINRVRAQVQRNPNAATVSDSMLWMARELQRAFPADLQFQKEVEDDEEFN
jgi:RHS repeat-associated protein